MPGRCYLINLILELTLFQITLCSVLRTFSNFQELSAKDFRVRMKRNAYGKLQRKTLAFEALGRFFQLSLTPGTPILSKDFILAAVHSNGSESLADIDAENIYYGTVVGENNSSVFAAQHSGIWMASIISHHDNYYIEPLQNHTSTVSISMQSMIIYRGKDVMTTDMKMNVSSNNIKDSLFCRGGDFRRRNIQLNSVKYGNSFTKAPERLFGNIYFNRKKERKSDGHYMKVNQDKGRRNSYRRLNRQHRSTDAQHDTCDIFVLADYKAYSGFGKKSVSFLSKFLVVVYSEVDKIFKETKFGPYENIRLVIRKMKIFTSNLNNDSMSQNLYLAREVIHQEELLAGLSQISELRNYCVAHLTTQRTFANGALGIAIRLSLGFESTSSSGICGSTVHHSKNVGLSTLVDKGNRLLPFSTYVRVVAHEIGHIFGAEHDDALNPQCVPSSNQGGSYIMWFQSTSSKGPNQSKFSPCSRRQIATILKERAKTCLKSGHTLRHNLCGNGIVDATEECDDGFTKMNNASTCCTSQCAFQDKAICSPFNHPCCTENCTIAPAFQRCNTKFAQKCYHVSYCTGTSFDMCPLPTAMADGSPCGDGGECQNGECISFCRLRGMRQNPPISIKTCSCDKNTTAMCSFCCFVVGHDESCRSYGGSYHDGAPCLIGTCSGGVCMKRSPELSAQWESGLSSTLKVLFQDNVTIGLGFVLVFTSIVISMATLTFIGSIIVTKIYELYQRKT